MVRLMANHESMALCSSRPLIEAVELHDLHTQALEPIAAMAATGMDPHQDHANRAGLWGPSPVEIDIDDTEAIPPITRLLEFAIAE